MKHLQAGLLGLALLLLAAYIASIQVPTRLVTVAFPVVALQPSIDLMAPDEVLEPYSHAWLFDVGIARIDDDPLYDLFTTNHLFGESYFRNRGSGFERFTPRGISPTDNENQRPPTGVISSPRMGLNVYVAGPRKLVLQCHDCPPTTRGTLTVAYNPRWTDTTVVQSTTAAKVASVEHEASIVHHFELAADGTIVFDADLLDLTHFFDIALPADLISIGPSQHIPDSASFSFSVRDNHSAAWTDYSGDGYTDVFVGMGGMRGRIGQFRTADVLSDHLYRFEPDQQRWERQQETANVPKLGCRTYQSGWLDIDADGDLDLYLGCLGSPNRLHRQRGIGSGIFEEVAEPLGLAILGGGNYRWGYWNNDDIPDLLTRERDRLALRLGNGASWAEPIWSPVMGEGLPPVEAWLRSGDLDGDGRMEALFGVRQLLWRFEWDGRAIRSASTDGIDLPARWLGRFSLVDADLNGRLDLDIVGGGVYQIASSDTFRLWQPIGANKRVQVNHAVWFDANLNGQWDLLVALRHRHGLNAPQNVQLTEDIRYRQQWPEQRFNLFWDRPATGTMLTIDLVGTRLNPDAIGARMRVITADGHEQTREVWGTDVANFSQGDYRQYIGLGSYQSALVKVRWPDGARSQHRVMAAAGRPVTLEHPER